MAAPFYVAVEPHPCAARALIEALGHGLDLELDVSALDEQIRDLSEEADAARERSEPFAQFIANLEEQYDEARPSLDAIDAAAAPELLADVESFLRDLRDAGDSGPSSSGAASGSS